MYRPVFLLKKRQYVQRNEQFLLPDYWILKEQFNIMFINWFTDHFNYFSGASAGKGREE